MPRPKQKRNKKKQQAKQRQKRQKEKVKERAESDRRIRYTVNKELPDVAVRKTRYTILSDKKVTLDEDKAFWYCDLPIFAGERKITEGHVQKLFDCLKRGIFDQTQVVLATCSYKGAVYKINGQHTCWAMVNVCEDSPSFNIQVREVRYGVVTEEDLRAVYSMFDQNLARSEGHLTKVRLVNTAVTEGVHSSLINMLTSGMKMWLFESTTERRRHRDAEMAALAKEHSNTFRSVAFLLQDNKDIFDDVKRQPVTAAMLATFDKVPRVAPQFWQPVIDGLNLTQKSDPRWRLKKYLAESSLGSTTRASNRKPVEREAMYRVCVAAWNKWRKDESANMTIRPTKRRLKPA